MEDTPQLAAANAAAASGAGIKATEDGDTVRFERQGPFGVWKWEEEEIGAGRTRRPPSANSQTSRTTASKQD